MTATNHLWHPPPALASLSQHTVHVWRAELNLPPWRIQQLALTLSPDEQQRANRFHFERDKRRFIASRGLLRTILGNYLDLEPAQLQFYYSTRGKPALTNTDSQGTLCFNVSHSNELALYAVTRDRSIGIDLEYLRPMPEAEQLAKRFFSPREYAVISSLPSHQKQEAFFKAWTSKEAYLKATGDGIAGLLEKIEVSLTPGEPAALLSIPGNPEAASQWTLHQLSPAPDYIGVLAVEGQNWHLECLSVVTK